MYTKSITLDVDISYSVAMCEENESVPDEMPHEVIDLIHSCLSKLRNEHNARENLFTEDVQFFLNVASWKLRVEAKVKTLLVDRIKLFKEIFGTIDHVPIIYDNKRAVSLEVGFCLCDARLPFFTHILDYEWAVVSPYDQDNIAGHLALKMSHYLLVEVKIEFHGKKIYIALMNLPIRHYDIVPLVNDFLAEENYYSVIWGKKLTILDQ